MTQIPPPPGSPPGGYPPGAYPGYQPPNQSPTSGLAIASMVVGILSIPCFCLWYVAIPLGIIAVILGFIAKGQADRGQAGGRGMALAGLICGSVGLVLAIILMIIALTAGPSLQNGLMNWSKQMQQKAQQQQQSMPSGGSTTSPTTEP